MGKALVDTFWLALLAGLGFAVAWRFVAVGRLRTAMQIAGTLLVLVPQLVILFLLYRFAALLLYQEAFLALWMLGVGTLIARRLWQRRTGTELGGGPPGWARWRMTGGEVAFGAAVEHGAAARRRERSPVAFAIIALVTLGFGVWMGSLFLADTLWPRVPVEGPVVEVRYPPGARTPRLADVALDGRRVHATRDVARAMRLGEEILAEVSAGSHVILRWERVAP